MLKKLKDCWIVINMDAEVNPAGTLKGEVQLPADKSISHRVAMFAALAEGESVIENYSDAADPESTLSCLEQLGISVSKKDSKVTISGKGKNGLSKPVSSLDCGNSGTTMRLMSGILAGAGIECTLIGDHSLSSRTMKRIVDPLQAMGCQITTRNGEFAPIDIKPNNGVKGMRYTLPIASAQLKSSVLLAGLYGDMPTEIVETVPSRDHTERLIGLESEAFGTGKLIRSSNKVNVPVQTCRVPGDFSAAAFWIVAALIHSGSEISLKNVGINPSRTALLAALEKMGGNPEISNPREEGKEPVADFKIKGNLLKAIELEPALIPNCIDELPILMVAMCFADGVSKITGAEELRHKETDRLSAMHQILQSAGAETELHTDGITIHGSSDFIPKAAEFESHHDHRMAMAAAVLATKSKEASIVKDADCTAISYPDFWQHLSNLTS